MLTISQNNRYILKDGKYFPYLADTAWTLVQRLTRDEIIFYLDKRASQGFNAVQVSAISELDGIRVSNREGFLPFEKGDVSKPVEEYFSLVCFVADECEKRNMILVLLPTWGDKFNQKWGVGPEIFTPENAFLYGEFLAQTIGARENIIWMLGGDRPLETEEHRLIIDSMADGIRNGETVKHLMTYHPCGEASSVDFVAQKDYIDFHSLQSGHSFGGFNSEKMIEKTLRLEDKPCLDAECFYEDFPIGFELKWNYRLCAKDIRRRIYKNLMAGALGHTYGHQSVWCFRDAIDQEYIYDWRTALERPMAYMMQNINRLTAAIDITSVKPANLACNAVSCIGNGFILVYIEDDKSIFVDTICEYTVKRAEWFNPVTGEFSEADLPQKNITATSPYENDAVLLLFI